MATLTRAENIERARQLIAAAEPLDPPPSHPRRQPTKTQPSPPRSARPSLSPLRQSHGDHRGVRAGSHAAQSTYRPGAQDQHRQLMTPSVISITMSSLLLVASPATMPHDLFTRSSHPISPRDQSIIRRTSRLSPPRRAGLAPTISTSARLPHTAAPVAPAKSP